MNTSMHSKLAATLPTVSTAEADRHFVVWYRSEEGELVSFQFFAKSRGFACNLARNVLGNLFCEVLPLD